ncbi:MAG: hypothetical protein AB4058_21910 [Microcystaceae cyanobacterium]
MTQPTDDDTFVAFLKTYQPSVPPASPQLESRLMAEISGHPRRKNQGFALLTLASAILAGLAIGGAVLQRNTLSPQIAISVDDLEHFLVEGWEQTLGHPLDVSYAETTNEEWLLLEDSQEESLNLQNY